MPGIGDAGDRLFNPPVGDGDDATVCEDEHTAKKAKSST
jgi:hypothetical protein